MQALDGATHPAYGQKGEKYLVVAEITKMYQEQYRVQAVSQGQQGRWTTWEGVNSQLGQPLETATGSPKFPHQGNL